jgi:hypothetical protein
MTEKIRVLDHDIIYLSYDEPNAEKNYADLCKKIPWAKRVHGVKGSDSAHKACADLSETEHFVTVDGDNIIDPAFLRLEIDLDELGLTKDHVFSWCGKIHVNGLMYGNGGLKLWNKKFVKNMRTHENSIEGDDKGKVEFCFDERYYQFNENYSTSYTNASPWQAWRAGFREGVKMSLDQGARVSDIKRVWWQNYDRLLIWSQVGADVENGIWSILGARQGCYMTNSTDWDYSNVKDFEWLNNFWDNEVAQTYENALKDCRYYGTKLIEELDLEIDQDPLSPKQSKFFKTVYRNTPRIIRKRK